MRKYIPAIASFLLGQGVAGVLAWLGQTTLALFVSIGFVIIGLGLFLFHFVKGKRSEERTGASPIEAIKSYLITMNSCEREVAVEKAKQVFPKEVAMKVHSRFTSMFGSDIIVFAVSLTQKIVVNRDVDPLVKMFKTFGDILDSTNYGLKQALEDSDVYKSSRIDLANKRLKLTKNKNKNPITQKNIDRVVDLIYGLNSSIVIRSVLRSLPEEYLTIMTPIVIALEGIESQTEKTLNTMLNDLENEWKVTVNLNAM